MILKVHLSPPSLNFAKCDIFFLHRCNLMQVEKFCTYLDSMRPVFPSNLARRNHGLYGSAFYIECNSKSFFKINYNCLLSDM